MKPTFQIPTNNNLPVSLLAGVFNKTTATYKFYWFISLLEILIERQQSTIPKRTILARMICNSWYPIHYFKISFGYFDMLSKNSQEIQRLLDLPIDINKDELFELLLNTNDRRINSLINHFDKQVPYRFLSPWFPQKSNAQIVQLSNSFEDNCLYRIIENKPRKIDVNPEWISYLNLNYKILMDFCYWNLAIYLQAKNPNVPDIPNKLVKPITRGALTKQRNFWKIVFDDLKEIPCIYTNSVLIKDSFSVEHFIPYSFVSHDLLWNLIPVNPIINISKGNKLPDLEVFLDKFVEVQHFGLKSAFLKNPNNKLLEDYLILGGNISELVELTHYELILRYKKILTPLVQIAENMGFELWKLNKNQL